MAKWRLSSRADRDIRDIFVYGAEVFGEEKTLEYLGGLETCFATLANFPLLGRPAEDVGSNVRRLEHRRHVAFYEPTTNGVLIIAVIHERSVERP